MIEVPVVIIGAGLVGASIGCALTREGTKVHLQDRERSHAVVAASRGGGVVDDPDPESVGLVVVAIPPEAIPTVVNQSLEKYPYATVTDVGSVKGQIVEDLILNNVGLARYVGSHPMAGSHLTGPITANADLFLDRTWVIAASEETSADSVELVRQLATSCGSRIIEMSIDEHDEAVAQVSHVPQIMSSLTAAHLRQIPKEHLLLAGQGIRDVTRIAGSDPELWQQIITANCSAIRKELEGVRKDLDLVLSALDDPDLLEDFLADGRDWARSLPGKHGLDRADYEIVIVQIPDEPGSLARLFKAIEDAGVNVEDVSIEHDPQRTVGFLSIQVESDTAETLRRAISANGWSLRT